LFLPPTAGLQSMELERDEEIRCIEWSLRSRLRSGG